VADAQNSTGIRVPPPPHLWGCVAQCALRWGADASYGTRVTRILPHPSSAHHRGSVRCHWPSRRSWRRPRWPWKATRYTSENPTGDETSRKGGASGRRAGKDDKRGGGEVKFTPITGRRAPTGPRGRRARWRESSERRVPRRSQREKGELPPWNPYQAPATA
jgi:hypothetical protein